MMFEGAKRGGMCTIGSDRYAQSNNKHLKEYDPTKPPVSCFHTDANGLYSGAMSNPLPIGGYKWEKDDRFDEDYIKSIPVDGITSIEKDKEVKRGFLFEIDGYFPKEVHELLKDYVPLPENKAHAPSKYMKEIATKMGIKLTREIKLIGSFEKKENYIVHYAELKSAMRLGFRVTKVHRAASFIQERWMSPHIKFNQEKRAQAKNEFEKSYYKLANNAVYGKTMENVRNRRDVKLTTNEKKKKKLANSAWFKDFKMYGNNLVAVEMAKKNIIMNKPIAVGVAVLAWSKAHMFDFFYHVMKKKYGDKVKMHYTDTDSLFVSVETEDLYKDMAEDLEFTSHLDLSNYPDNHVLFENYGNKDALLKIKKDNKDVFGKFKDESAGKSIYEMCFIRAKMYSYIKEGADVVNPRVLNKKGQYEGVTAKGVKKSAVKYLTHEKYKKCLLSDNIEDFSTVCSFFRIASKDHELMTLKQEKKALSHYDDKRDYIDAIHSLPFGYEST